MTSAARLRRRSPCESSDERGCAKPSDDISVRARFRTRPSLAAADAGWKEMKRRARRDLTIVQIAERQQILEAVLAIGREAAFKDWRPRILVRPEHDVEDRQVRVV